jgi:peptide/nickel transport system ATP-binding protein
MSENIIEVRGLTVDFPLRRGTGRAVNNVDFDIPKGKITAVVGESGSGKSTLASAILRVVSSPGLISAGSVIYKGKDVLQYSKEELQKYRWEEVSMVFQAAQNALNPVMTVKEQIIETVQAHTKEMTEEDILTKASKLLEYVRLEPKRVLGSYPHELSGGMKQRVMIAFALLMDPELVILDEPTTALDVITQDYIFDILAQIHKDLGITMMLNTHDIGVVAKVADRIGVMYAGHIVEVGDIYTIFENSDHPYTTGLMNAAPSLIEELKDKDPIKGSPPDIFNLPTGCPFNPRCNDARDICFKEKPTSVRRGDDHIVSCHKYCNPKAYGQEAKK